MIIYRGWGFLALICYVASAVVIGSVLNWGFGIDFLATKQWWPLHVIFFAGALLTYAVGWFLNRDLLEETVYEKTGPVIVLKPRHTLYFVRMEYWGPIILAIYIVAFVVYQLR